MNTVVKTKLYDFSICLSKFEKCYFFEIVAICNRTKTKSRITNLNFIISELLEPIIEFESYETTIEVDKTVGNEIYSKAVESFNDREWVNYLFIKLEDDRDAGEWS